MRFGKRKNKDEKTRSGVEDTNKNERDKDDTAIQSKTAKLNDQLIIDKNEEKKKKRGTEDKEQESKSSKKKEKKDKKASKV